MLPWLAQNYVGQAASSGNPASASQELGSKACAFVPERNPLFKEMTTKLYTVAWFRLRHHLCCGFHWEVLCQLNKMCWLVLCQCQTAVISLGVHLPLHMPTLD